MNEIRLIDPRKLANHELLNRLPPLAPDDPSVLKVVQSIRDLGRITDPLKVTEQGLLVDGRRRRAAALRLKMDLVPCVYVEDGEIPSLIIAQLAARAHFTKSQRAYLLLPFVQDAFDYANERKLAALKKGEAVPVGHSVPNGVKRVDEWADSAGISHRLLKQAQELTKFLEDETPRTITDKDGVTEAGVSFKEFFEPRILREEDPYGLGAALTGIKQILDIERKKGVGQAHTGGKPTESAKQLQLFERIWAVDFRNRREYWAKFNSDQKAHALHTMLEASIGMPKDLFLDYLKGLKGIARRQKWEGL